MREHRKTTYRVMGHKMPHSEIERRRLKDLVTNPAARRAKYIICTANNKSYIKKQACRGFLILAGPFTEKGPYIITRAPQVRVSRGGFSPRIPHMYVLL